MKIRNKQCEKCPWKVSTDPNEIPRYSKTLHESLGCTTIAEPGDIRGSRATMACHESLADEAYPCVGWLVHQLGPGNNIGLRMLALDGRFKNLQVVGEQHERFEDTLPDTDDEIDWGDDDDT